MLSTFVFFAARGGTALFVLCPEDSNMKPSELQSFLTEAIPARLPVLVTGAPGIGKSDIVAQAARDAGADLILSHPAVADPTDAKGLPWVVDGRATFLPFGELRRALDATRPTVWFLDDLGQASPAVQASYMQLLLARRVNGHVLSDHVTFIAATNRRTDRAGVSGVLEPVKSRFGSIVELVPDVTDWSRWAITAGIPAVLIAYLRFQPDHLCKFAATADLTNSPSPRTWAHVARILGLNLAPAVQHAVIAGAVGEAAALEFIAFMRMFSALPSVDAVLLDPYSVAIPTEANVLYALTSALAYRATQQNAQRIAQFVERLISERDARGDVHGEFGVLLARDAVHRTPAIAQTAAFVRLFTGDLGSLMSGVL